MDHGGSTNFLDIWIVRLVEQDQAGSDNIMIELNGESTGVSDESTLHSEIGWSGPPYLSYCSLCMTLNISVIDLGIFLTN